MMMGSTPSARPPALRRVTVAILRIGGRIDPLDVGQTEMLAAIRTAIDATALTSVNLQDGRRLYLDDDGDESVKPINDPATRLYNAVWRTKGAFALRGDVAIVTDLEDAQDAATKRTVS
jgi:hypothetical protein